jgi:pimeloyl-ACP methyl ester carboxylesterase
LAEKEILTLGDQVIEYELIGSGKPTIIFLNGFGARMDLWKKVKAELAGEGTQLLYNRTGLGKSSKAKVKQRADIVVATLRDLLKSKQLEPPYVLVGWSIGGLFANLFARKYPSETQAVVFVESSSSNPDEVKILESHAPLPLRVIDSIYYFIFRLFPNYENWEISVIEESRVLVNEAGVFPEVPVVVVSGAKTGWLRSQALADAGVEFDGELASLTSSSRHIVSSKSGHIIAWTEPELVADAIRDAISKS